MHIHVGVYVWVHLHVCVYECVHVKMLMYTSVSTMCGRVQNMRSMEIFKFIFLQGVLCDWINSNIVRELGVLENVVSSQIVYTVVPGLLKDYRPYVLEISNWADIGDFKISLEGKRVDLIPIVAEGVARFEISSSVIGAGANVTVWSVSGFKLVPLPSEIFEFEKQFVVLSDLVIVPTMYATEKTKTTVFLPKGVYLENVSPLKLFDVKSGQLTIGPLQGIDEISQLKSETFDIHFAHNLPLPFIQSVRKSVDVSHLGAAVTVHEQVTLHNGAAGLKGEFNRVPFTHMKFSNDENSPFRIGHVLTNVGALIPFDAVNVDYRDVIGNISSSSGTRVSENGLNFTYISLQPRFPMMGNWKTEYEFSYVLPMMSGNYVQQLLGGAYLLSIPVSHALPNVFAKKQTVAVTLPAGSYGVELFLGRRRLLGEYTVSAASGWLDSGLFPWAVRQRVEFDLGAMYTNMDDFFADLLHVKYSQSIYGVYKAPFLLTMYLFVLIVSILLLRRIRFEIMNPHEIKEMEMSVADYDVCKAIEDELVVLAAIHTELIQCATFAQIAETKNSYTTRHLEIQKTIEQKCTLFSTPKNKLDRTVRILMNLKAQKDAAIAFIDAISLKKDPTVSATKLVESEKEVQSLVGRVLTGEPTPPPSPSVSTPPSSSLTSKRRK